jgi:hypothetical protein
MRSLPLTPTLRESLFKIRATFDMFSDPTILFELS